MLTYAPDYKRQHIYQPATRIYLRFACIQWLTWYDETRHSSSWKQITGYTKSKILYYTKVRYKATSILPERHKITLHMTSPNLQSAAKKCSFHCIPVVGQNQFFSLTVSRFIRWNNWNPIPCSIGADQPVGQMLADWFNHLTKIHDHFQLNNKVSK